MIPQKEPDGTWTALYYQPDPAKRHRVPKLKAGAGAARALWPSLEPAGDDWTVFVEGEPDAIAGYSAGLQVTGLPGVTNWRSEWAERFADRRVAIIFDSDKHGRTAAAQVAADLAPYAAEVRIVDLDQHGSDGYDLTDELLSLGLRSDPDNAGALLRRRIDEVPTWAPSGAGETAEDSLPTFSFGVVLLADFASVDEAGADALLGSHDQPLLPAAGEVLVYGDGGAGKTTLTVDLACHLAAGDDWLGIGINRPVRVLLIENEGPRPHFRVKLRRKLEAWAGSDLGDRIMVVETPWGKLDVSIAEHRVLLAAELERLEIDVLIAGPVTRIGMHEAGTLQQVRDFDRFFDEIRDLAGRPVAFVLIHHEGRSGAVSGAWEGTPDTILHVASAGHGTTRLRVQKARWASDYQARTMMLRWGDGETFTVAEQVAPPTDEEIESRICAAILEHPGATWKMIRDATPGIGNEPRQAARDRLLLAGQIVNVIVEQGADRVVDTVPHGRPARMYLSGDPGLPRPLFPAPGTVSGTPEQ